MSFIATDYNRGHHLSSRSSWCGQLPASAAELFEAPRRDGVTPVAALHAAYPNFFGGNGRLASARGTGSTA